MKRRNALLGAAAAPLSAALPASASGDSPMMALFREWHRTNRLINLGKVSEAAGERAFQHMLEIEDQMSPCR